MSCNHEWESVKCTCSPDCKRIHKYCLKCGHHEVNDIKSYQDQLVKRVEEERARIARHYRISEHADDAGYLNALDWLIALIKEGK